MYYQAPRQKFLSLADLMNSTPSPQLGYIQNPLDRVHNNRETEGFIDEMSAREDSLAVVLAGDRPLYRKSDNPGATALFSISDAMALAPEGETLFLGIHPKGLPVFARLAKSVEDPGNDGDMHYVTEKGPADVEHCDLRGLALRGVVPAPEAGIVALARSLFAWHESHKFCSTCGKPSNMTLGGYRRECPDCGALHFPRTDPVTIMLVTHGEQALMARGAHFAPGMYSAIAGFMEPGETIEDAVARETFEETGLHVGTVTYHMSQPWPFPSTLMIGCYAESTTTELTIDTSELEDARWVSRDELAASLRGEADFSPPADFAIAHHLVRGFVDGV